MQIFKFNSNLKPVLWGGHKLLTFKGLPASNEYIGESWELSAMPGRESVVASGEEKGMTLSQLVRHYREDLVGESVYRRYGNQFPLLIKFIDARRDLSVQVHPDEKMARQRHGCSGKNEMWYVLHTDEHALIRAGFNRQLTVEEFDRRLSDGTILDVVNAMSSRPGDVFYLPAGRIHTIGAGNMLVEIQQSSDITYRVWDFNRRDVDGNLRPLHIQEAREALDFTPYNGRLLDMPSVGPNMTQLVKCDQFEVRHLVVDDHYTMPMPSPRSFVAIVCIHGNVDLVADELPPTTLRQGETVLVPAIANTIEFTGTARLLLATVPESGMKSF